MAIRLKRSSYFSIPGKRHIGGGGMPTPRTLLTVLLLLAVATVGYVRLLLPEIGVLQCGIGYAEAVEAWVAAGSIEADTPTCTSLIPADLQRLEDFLPLLLFTGLAFVVVRRQGSLTSLPALVLTQVALWLAPSPPVALAVALVGLVVACLPWMARGWLASLSHIGAILMWPSIALAVVAAADTTTVAIPDGLDWLISLAIFGILPGLLILTPITGARINYKVQGAAVAFFAAVILILVFVSATAAAGSVQQSNLTPANVGQTNLHVAQSGQSTVYAGYAGTPAGARTYSFLQDGITAEVHWSSVRGYEARFTTAVIGTWTNPTATGCTAVSGQCGHLSLAVPSEGAPGVPDFITVGAGPEVAIDATAWHSHLSPLTLYGAEYDVVATNSALIPVGVPVVLRWRPWDGLGAPSLPIR